MPYSPSEENTYPGLKQTFMGYEHTHVKRAYINFYVLTWRKDVQRVKV